MHSPGEPEIQWGVTDKPEEAIRPRAIIQFLGSQEAATGPTDLTATDTPIELHRSERVSRHPAYLHDYVS